MKILSRTFIDCTVNFTAFGRLRLVARLFFAPSVWESAFSTISIQALVLWANGVLPVTLKLTAKAPENGKHPKGNSSSNPSLFGGNVSFREGISWCDSAKTYVFFSRNSCNSHLVQKQNACRSLNMMNCPTPKMTSFEFLCDFQVRSKPRKKNIRNVHI